MTATTTPAQPSPGDPSRGLPGDDYVGEEMTLVEHLTELRSRLFKSALALVIGFAIGFALRFRVLDIIKRPYCELPAELRRATESFDPTECSMVSTEVLGPFVISLKAAAIVMILIAAPTVCYQIWRFVTPGLRPVERRFSIPFIVASQVLFLAGAAFSYFLIPRALVLLLGFAGDDFVPLLDANRYFTFMINTMLAFGISFQFPVALILLALMGVVTSAGLRQYRRYSLMGLFVVAAVLTPTQDPATMLAMAAPLVAFYEVSIVAARLIERRRARTLARTLAA